MEITSLSQLDLTKTYNYADYLTWKIKERVELFKGKIMQMSPAPASKHQRLSRIIGTSLINFLEKQPCEVFYAPFDVRLERTVDNKKVQSVVQPDICVICDATKIDERGCSGAPELMIEILSPGNSKKEMKQKFELYQEAGVLEYWIVQPSEEVIWQYVLENGEFINRKPIIVDDSIKSAVIEGFELPLTKVFES